MLAEYTLPAVKHFSSMLSNLAGVHE